MVKIGQKTLDCFLFVTASQTTIVGRLLTESFQPNPVIHFPDDAVFPSDLSCQIRKWLEMCHCKRAVTRNVLVMY